MSPPLAASQRSIRYSTCGSTAAAAARDSAVRGPSARFSATPRHDTFEGLWEVAETPGAWRDDLKVTYRRAVPNAI